MKCLCNLHPTVCTTEQETILRLNYQQVEFLLKLVNIIKETGILIMVLASREDEPGEWTREGVSNVFQALFVSYLKF